MTATLKSQGIIPAASMPPVEVIVVEEAQPEGPYGAKGAGEAVLVPTPAAVAGALRAFDGRWRTALPMRDSAAARARRCRGRAGPAARRARFDRREGAADVGGHAGPRVRPPPPVLGARPGDARARRKVATSFAEILEQVWWRLDAALDLEMIRWSAMLGALEALENGTTAIVDHHESPNAIEGSLDVIAEACAEVGVRSLLAYGITDRHGPDGARRGLAENERFIRAGGRGLVGDPCRLHLLGRVPARRRRPGPRTSAWASTSTSARASATPTRRAGSPASRATTGCWRTASTCRRTTPCGGRSSTTRCRT